MTTLGPALGAPDTVGFALSFPPLGAALGKLLGALLGGEEVDGFELGTPEMSKLLGLVLGCPDKLGLLLGTALA